MQGMHFKVILAFKENTRISELGRFNIVIYYGLKNWGWILGGAYVDCPIYMDHLK
jgi:hypothetical protein